MKQLGFIIHKIDFYNIYIVHVGLGQLRYFRSSDKLYIGDIILYYNYTEEDYDGLIIEYKYPLNDYHYIGHINNSFHHQQYVQYHEYPDKIIAIKGDFVIWDREDSLGRIMNMDPLDYRTDCLLHRLYCSEECLPPSEEEISSHCITRRGSDNYLHSWTDMTSSYDYPILYDSYFSQMFPSINIRLKNYDEQEEETTIHPDYPDRSQWQKAAKQKENELKAQALEIYLNSYSKDAHINKRAYSKISSAQSLYASKKAEIAQKKALAELYWDGFDFEETIAQLDHHPYQFIKIIKDNNLTYDMDAILRQKADKE